MKCVKKFDARPKLDGSWKFIDDYTYDDILHGQLLYSTCHHGYIKKINFPTNYDLSEFTMVSPKDIPGENIVPEPVCVVPSVIDQKRVFVCEKELLSCDHHIA